MLSKSWAVSDISIKKEDSLIKHSFISEQNSSGSSYEKKDLNDSVLIENALLTENVIIEDANESDGKDFQITLSGSEGNASGKNKTDTEKAEITDLNVSISEDEIEISKNLHIEETIGSGIRNEAEFTSNIDENDSLTESLKITSLGSLDEDSLEMTEIKNEITLLREGFSEKVSQEAEPDRILEYILIALWFPLVGWMVYQQRGKKDDKLAIKRLENSFEIINQQFSKLPVLEDFKILLSNRVKSDDTQTSEMSETPQSSEIDSLHAKLDENLRSFSTLKKTLDEKDRDIRQLRKGIDAEIYKGMIKKFIRLEEVFHQEIDALSEDETKTKEVLSDMCEILQDTFFDCGVEEFSPEVGESIIDAFGTSDNYERIKIDDSSLHLQIAEVKRSGYFLNSANGRECLKKSEVKVFINMKNGEDK